MDFHNFFLLAITTKDLSNNLKISHCARADLEYIMCIIYCFRIILLKVRIKK